MLTARTAEEDYVEAAAAQRGVAYACRNCREPVILHAGKIRPRHFQHRPDTACAFGSRMSEAHLNAQRALAAALRGRGVNVELEAWLPALAGDRRIDVLAYPPGDLDRRIAIEVQQVDITVEAIAARSASYRAQGVAPLWLRLLDFDRFDPEQRLAGSGEVWIERYRARSWERWAHKQARALWFYDAGVGRLWRGRFTKGYGWSEGSEWYEAGGVYQSNPGGYTEVTQWVGLALQGPYDPDAVKLTRSRSGGGLVANFVPPDEPPPPLRRKLRTELKGTYLIETCELERQIGGAWEPVQFEAVQADWRRSGPEGPDQ
jgi:hypothetical protein